MAKRSKHVALLLVGAAAFTLAGCQEEAVDASAFADLQSCKAQAGSNETMIADCVAGFEAAQEIHVESAPRYEDRAACETAHGEGACGSEAEATAGATETTGATGQQSGSGSIFMPLMAGYLIGSMLSNNRAAGARPPAQPMYKAAGGGFTNAAGSSSYSSNAGKAKLGASHFAKPPSTIGKAPMTKAAVAARGGFGASGSARSTSGG